MFDQIEYFTCKHSRKKTAMEEKKSQAREKYLDILNADSVKSRDV